VNIWIFNIFAFYMVFLIFLLFYDYEALSSNLSVVCSRYWEGEVVRVGGFRLKKLNI